MNNSGIEFLNRLYKDLYKSPEVMSQIDERFIGNKVENIKRYIDRLDYLHKRVLESGRENDLKLLKELYYRKYVIKEEDIPESYYRHLEDIEHQLGKGRKTLSKEERHEKAQEIIASQKKSLDKWIDYFVSEETKHIPTWAKYWAFQGMLSLGNYDVEKQKFLKRSKNTISPFADLNKEALNVSIDLLISCLDGKKIEDYNLELLAKSGSFNKIYGYLINSVSHINRNSKAGIWVKYSQGTDYLKLYNSLQGYNTNWCTADDENKAHSHLAMGDFYVYYSYDANGIPRIPRIAIRMEGNHIMEVRGIAESQNLEAEMEEIAESKLQEFADKEKFHKKVNDMKKLTAIYKKHKNNIQLSLDELKFLYEVDEHIEGFGFQNDTRIREIINTRDAKKDLSLIYQCTEEQIGTNRHDLEKDLDVYYGGLNIFSSELSEFMKLPPIFYGHIYFSNLKSVEKLTLPIRVNGNINLDGIETPQGLTLPKIINGSLSLRRLKNADGLVFPKDIIGSLLLNSIENASNLILPNNILGNLDLSSLKNSDGLTLPSFVDGFINLNNLQTANGLIFPRILNGGLYLKSLKYANGLVLPASLNGDLDLSSLESINNLKLPQVVSGNLTLDNINSAIGLQLPTVLSGDLSLNGLVNTKGLQLPQIFNGGLYLNGIKDANDLKLPTKLLGDLSLNGLEVSDGLELPDIIDGNIYLTNLDNLDNLKLPSSFKKIFLSHGVCVTPDNVDEYITNKKVGK